MSVAMYLIEKKKILKEILVTVNKKIKLFLSTKKVILISSLKNCMKVISIKIFTLL